jgi:FkbM family methyltransferase
MSGKNFMTDAPDDDIDWDSLGDLKSLNPAVASILEMPPARRERILGRMALATLRYLKKSAAGKDDFQLFLATVSAHAPKSKGQLFQDLWAWWESDCRTGGYFIEFGAANGVHLSNTYFLEKEMGWNGILAEPHPDFQESVRKNRSCFISRKCVYSRSGETVSFLAAKAGEYARIENIRPDDTHEAKGLRTDGRKVEVETISLNDLLDEAKAPPEIDYMSVDTEGSEYEILSAFDFSRRSIRCISVEHNSSPARKLLFDLLTANGYRRKWETFSAFDDWYVRT